MRYPHSHFSHMHVRLLMCHGSHARVHADDLQVHLRLILAMTPRYTDGLEAFAGSKLAPEDSQQLVQQGGAVLLQGGEIRFLHRDTGPLMFVDVEKLADAVRSCSAATMTGPPR